MRTFKPSLAVAIFMTLVSPATHGFPALPPAERSGKELTALERKLHGYWEAEGDCIGNIRIHANGGFAWTGIGPGSVTRVGTWHILWDALPPTLVFVGTRSDDENEKSFDVRIVRLDDSHLAIEYPQRTATVRFTRSQK